MSRRLHIWQHTDPDRSGWKEASRGYLMGLHDPDWPAIIAGRGSTIAAYCFGDCSGTASCSVLLDRNRVVSAA